MPKVSIIIPSYNPPQEHIHECLESILNQSFKDYEIIIVDDGSTIDTRSILSPYKDRIRHFFQERGGPNKARQRGLREARGEYIALIDQDDVWVPHKLEQQVEFLDAYPNVDFIFSDFHNFNTHGFIGPSFFKTNSAIQSARCIPAAHDDTYKIISDKEITYKYLRGDFIIQCTAMARTSFCRKINIFLTKTQGRTFHEFFIKTIHLLTVGFINEVLAHRRIHDHNITHDSGMHFSNAIHIYQDAIQYPWIDKKCRKFIKKALHESRFQLGKYHVIKGNYQQAREVLKIAMRERYFDVRIIILYCMTFFIPKNILFGIKNIKKSLKKTNYEKT